MQGVPGDNRRSSGENRDKMDTTMKKPLLWIVALAALLCGVLLGQEKDITGTWQGTLKAGKDLRIVLKVSKADAGGLKAVMYSIDQGGQPAPIATVSFQYGVLKFTVTVVCVAELVVGLNWPLMVLRAGGFCVMST